MKVLIATDWYAPVVNGVVSSVLNLQRELEAQGHEVRVLTLSQTLRTRAEKNVTYIGAVSAGIVYPGARLRAALGSRQIQELIRWRPDVIHTQCEFSTFFMARKIAGCIGAPIVHTYHTVYEDYTHYFSPSQIWGRKVVAKFSRHIIAQTACVIAPTEKVRKILESYRVRRPVYVVPSGIDLRRFTVASDETRCAELKEQMGIPKENFVLAFVGRLAKEKNIEELFSRMRELSRRDVTLLLVGDGPYRAELEQTVREMNLADQVVFAGMVPPDRVVEYYHLGDLFVSASTSETQGLTYIEALAAGLPALCRRDTCLDGVLADGVNGWQFDGPEDFSVRLAAFLADAELRQRMSLAAAELAARSFSAPAFAQRVADIYAAVTEKEESCRTA